MCGGDTPQAPEQPSIAATSAEAINAQVAAMPQIYQTKMEYAPKFTAQDLALQQQFGPQYAQYALDMYNQFGDQYAQTEYDLQSKYAPQYAQLQADIQGQTGAQYAQQNLDIQNQFGTQYAQALRDQQGVLNPSMIAGQDALTAYLSQEDEMTPQEVAKAQQDVRNAGAARGMAESGMNAQDELAKLTDLRQQLKTRRLNLALQASQANTGTPVIPTTASGSTYQPISTGAQQAQTPTVANSQYVQGINPTNAFGLASNNYSTATGLYSNQQQQASNQASSIFGGILSAAGSLGGAALQKTSSMLCVPEGTLVEGINGEKVKIEDIKVGDFVRGGSVKKISKQLTGENFIFCELITDKGTIIASRDHPVYAKLLDIKKSDIMTDYAYDILTDSGFYYVNDIKLGSTIKE